MYICAMRPQKVLDTEILSGLAKVFRSKGYEGASLADLADATGLKKASLYHRYPGGKQEMADAVLSHIDKWVEENVFGSFLDENMTPQDRLKNGLNQIRTLYDDGREVCIFRALSMENGLEFFEEQVKNGMKEWIATFEEVGLAFNISQSRAQEMAIQTLTEIQGSLIVSKGLNDLSVFEKALQHIENRYLET